MWMGGFVPLGYNVCDWRIVIDEGEAESVQYIFRRYQDLGCVRLLKEHLDRRGILSKRRTSEGVSSQADAHSREEHFTRCWIDSIELTVPARGGVQGRDLENWFLF
jgi:hypothetical protein